MFLGGMTVGAGGARIAPQVLRAKHLQDKLLPPHLSSTCSKNNKSHTDRCFTLGSCWTGCWIWDCGENLSLLCAQSCRPARILAVHYYNICPFACDLLKCFGGGLPDYSILILQTSCYNADCPWVLLLRDARHTCNGCLPYVPLMVT